MIDWNDTITVTLHKDKHGKIVIPKSVIKGLSSKTKTNYGATPPSEDSLTIIHVDINWADAVGIDLRYAHKRELTVALEVDTDLKIVLALLRGDVAAEVLF